VAETRLGRKKSDIPIFLSSIESNPPISFVPADKGLSSRNDDTNRISFFAAKRGRGRLNGSGTGLGRCNPRSWLRVRWK
jgi:hypothetical protein